MEHKMKAQNMHDMSYKKFVIMMLISFFIMYIVMFLNMDKLSHYHTSITRIYMAILMVTPMAIVMLILMGKMYPNKKTNIIIMLTAAVIFVIVLIGLRTQTPISDVQYMKAMIPHHSSAILNSKKANLKDPEVIRLSKEIITSQEREIAEMETMLKRLNK